MDWDLCKTFVAVADTGSFTGGGNAGCTAAIRPSAARSRRWKLSSAPGWWRAPPTAWR